MKKYIRKSKADYVIEQIQEWILENELGENSLLLSEAEFSQQLNVSKATVREALRKLEIIGIVDIKHGKRARISKLNLARFMNVLKMCLIINKNDFLDFMELRKILELGAIENAISKMTKERLLNLEGFIHLMEKNLLNRELFAINDYNFHLEIIKTTNNILLLKLMDIIGIALLKLQKITSRFPSRKLAIPHHKDILNAIKNKDIVKAKKVLIEHITNTENTLICYFDSVDNEKKLKGENK